ncbi:uncharacterized protein LOC119106426 isoform X2 [Pollicipes pollicipes]|nr:uncharacterized protein LOC119106426 isoform X2 [Pollicipes pollicipes]
MSTQLATYLLMMADHYDSVNPFLITNITLQSQLEEELQTALIKQKTTAFGLLEDISPKCRELVLGCYMQDRYLDTDECCRDVLSHVVYYQARCVSTMFSSLLSDWNQTRPGDSGGLSILLRENRTELYSYMDARYALATSTSGMRVVITPYHGELQDSMGTNSHILPSGHLSMLALKMTEIEVTAWYRDILHLYQPACIALPSQKDISRSTRLSTLASCDLESLRERYRASCNCTPLLMHSLTDDQPSWDDVCTPLQLLSCRSLSQDVHKTSRLVRGPSCRSLCTELTYESAADSTPFKREFLTKGGAFQQHYAAGHNWTMSAVNIFFNRLNYRRIELSKTSLWDWLGAFGGQTSLLIGASVITMLELTAFSGWLLGQLCWRLAAGLVSCCQLDGTTAAVAPQPQTPAVTVSVAVREK